MPPPALRGVYIWGFQFEEAGLFTPYYVGQGEDVRVRLFDHIRRLLAGDYIVWHQDVLPRFPRYKNPAAYWDRSVLPYFPGRQNPAREGSYLPERNVLDFIERRAEIRPHLDYMIECFAFTYSPVVAEIHSWPQRSW